MTVGDQITVANIGDSRTILLARRDDEATRAHALTWEHSPEDLDEQLRIVRANGGIIKTGLDSQDTQPMDMADYDYPDLKGVIVAGPTEEDEVENSHWENDVKSSATKRAHPDIPSATSTSSSRFFSSAAAASSTPPAKKQRAGRCYETAASPVATTRSMGS